MLVISLLARVIRRGERSDEVSKVKPMPDRKQHDLEFWKRKLNNRFIRTPTFECSFKGQGSSVLPGSGQATKGDDKAGRMADGRLASTLERAE